MALFLPSHMRVIYATLLSFCVILTIIQLCSMYNLQVLSPAPGIMTDLTDASNQTALNTSLGHQNKDVQNQTIIAHAGKQNVKLLETVQLHDDATSDCSAPCPIIFIHIQKTGGDSVRKLLNGARLWEKRDHKKHAPARIMRESYTEDEWNRACKIAFIRNPWDRLLSWYSMWMLVEHQHGLRNNGAKSILRQCECDQQCSFDHFISNCTKTVVYHGFQRHGKKWNMSITLPYMDYIADPNGEILVDYIGRTERLSEDLETFLKVTCNYKPGIMQRLPHIDHGSKHAEYHEYYNNYTAHLVKQWYSVDLAVLFNYSF